MGAIFEVFLLFKNDINLGRAKGIKIEIFLGLLLIKYISHRFK